MPRYIAFLRGINLGRRRIKMDALRAVFEKLPVTDVATYIASGNVLFTSTARSATVWQDTIAAHLENELGYAVNTIVRTRAELTALVAQAPLGELFCDQPHASTQVTLFAAPVTSEIVTKLDGFRTTTDAFAVVDRELYWRCATKLTASTVWKDTKINPHHFPTGTTRNLQTLQKLAELYPA
ncbi:DUF1697 domain-containing protein [Synoicihabitans lomoniglobus]|uniref:DUF1697 domain-containing protein n=1 Tax=Synoicihabitans lomoniglobus TaxID=2909285 RepID=A0AAF0CLK4_9BACT|nr:DUF1697 domain-containing protein [Opitutaceae bacterium LMO-M01]WED62988.1 DUF1697 domain-containing protein [Opitutaceae bacterium LMO-M01]